MPSSRRVGTNSGRFRIVGEAEAVAAESTTKLLARNAFPGHRIARWLNYDRIVADTTGQNNGDFGRVSLNQEIGARLAQR